MPEGDSIHRAASILRPLLVDQALTAVHINGARHDRLSGLTVTGVAATGKHLTIDLGGGEWQLRVHLGMNGRWRRYRAGAAAPASASLLLVTPTDTFACMRAPTVELTARRDARRGRAVNTLGPDLLAPGFDPAAAAARALATGATAIGITLLDQRVVAGIGNIYKCESLFLERIHPLTPTSSIPAPALAALYARASELMHAALRRGGPRYTRAPQTRYHVYRHVGRPCYRCGTRIATVKQGVQLRITYFCPRCQGAPSVSSL